MSEKEQRLIERISNYIKIVVWDGRYNYENMAKQILEMIKEDRETRDSFTCDIRPHRTLIPPLTQEKIDKLLSRFEPKEKEEADICKHQRNTSLAMWGCAKDYVLNDSYCTDDMKCFEPRKKEDDREVDVSRTKYNFNDCRYCGEKHKNWDGGKCPNRKG